jgi:uncharacterized damage-inducible protein DinB
MDIQDHFRLFSYDAWANQQVLNALKSADNPAGRSLKFLAHIIGAQRIWMERLLGQKQAWAVWPDLTLQQSESELQLLPGEWKSYLGSLRAEQLNEAIHYRNSKGEQWSSAREDILSHVIMHSVYHRGQIATEMRAQGYTPAYTDFIQGVRTGSFR